MLRHRDLLLELDLTTAPLEVEPDDPIGKLRSRHRPRLRAVLRALHEAGDDRHVRGLVVKVGGGLPWATMQELRAGVRAFAASGKPTVAWAEAFGEGSQSSADYVLASACDEIWLQPGSDLGLFGVAAETTFLRGALDKLGVEPQLDKRHEYKNAADRIMRSEFTPEHREAVERVVESTWDEAVATIAAARSLSVDEVRRECVALVDAHGEIVVGRSRPTPRGPLLGSGTVAAALRAAREDERVRAVLLRVVSPGGSSVASETIWREVLLTRRAGKPVVVSMGTVAGSGGYYIACPADVIVAQPATITGSIGVLGGKVVVADLLDRLGLTTGAVERGASARMFSLRRGFTDAERDRLAAMLDRIYADFVAKVADGRGMPVEAVDAVARGRIWSGADAARNGLVDELGGLRHAADVARRRAGLPADAPVRPAVHLPPLARLRRPTSSDDPRAGAAVGLGAVGDLGDLGALLGVPRLGLLRMPPVTLR
jgi:protease-4